MRIPGSDLILFHFYILIFQFFFLNVPFLQKEGNHENVARILGFSVKKRPKFGCLVFEFQISTSVQPTHIFLDKADTGVRKVEHKFFI